MQEVLALKWIYLGIAIVINYKVITVFIADNSVLFSFNVKLRSNVKSPKEDGAQSSENEGSCRNYFCQCAFLSQLFCLEGFVGKVKKFKLQEKIILKIIDLMRYSKW